MYVYMVMCIYADISNLGLCNALIFNLEDVPELRKKKQK